MKTLITLNKNFPSTGRDSLKETSQYNEMERLGLQPQTTEQEELKTDKDNSQWVYNNGVPLTFIKENMENIESVTVWADREEIRDLSDSIRGFKDWVCELGDISNPRIALSEGLTKSPEYKGFNVEICMPKSKYSKYFSVDEITSLLQLEDKIKHATCEEDIARIEEITIALEKDKALAERIDKSVIDRVASSDKISVFKISDLGYKKPNKKSAIYVFDRVTLDFSKIIESDIWDDLYLKKRQDGKVAISVSNSCKLCQSIESRPYKQFLQLCEFGAINKVKSTNKHKHEDDRKFIKVKKGVERV